MGMFDVDRSGSIGFNGEHIHNPMITLGSVVTEFAGLWKYVADWQGVGVASNDQSLRTDPSHRCSGSTTVITLERSRAENSKMPFAALGSI